MNRTKLPLLIAALAALFVAGCAGSPAAGESGAGYDQAALGSLLTSTRNLPDRAPGANPISVAIVTEGYLNRFASYAFFHDPAWDATFADPGWQHERNQRAVFTTNAPVTNFRFLELAMSDSRDDIVAFDSGVLYSLGELSPERPFVATWLALGGMPHRGVSFVDEAGATRYFSVWEDTMSDDGPRFVVSELARIQE